MTRMRFVGGLEGVDTRRDAWTEVEVHSARVDVRELQWATAYVFADSASDRGWTAVSKDMVDRFAGEARAVADEHSVSLEDRTVGIISLPTAALVRYESSVLADMLNKALAHLDVNEGMGVQQMLSRVYGHMRQQPGYANVTMGVGQLPAYSLEKALERQSKSFPGQD